MNRAQRVVLASAAAVLGSGLAIAPTAHAATEAPAASYHCTGLKSQYSWQTMADGSSGWTAGFSRTMTAIVGSGSQGSATAEAQCMLVGWHCKPGTVDGIYGANTRSAVVAFQRKNGLADDGVVGPNTWRKLRVAPSFC
ncbi:MULTISPECIES: peptidoglycan-binding domain-containing protein [Streptomyces]|uniref:Peptidoglycan-binding domain-containing protein n=1 Tax=Streptomyces silvisoli TaxID=3034235 RepID=A0ABT5ZKG8_9ACTN|nr:MULTISPECIES: peptidoglycan-binding domain-containing protein [Streptomyces]MDF3290315.1 peptidoglycan-binding domain-containing protein [Streptomyces silvisoli]